jgi:pullulanase
MSKVFGNARLFKSFQNNGVVLKEKTIQAGFCMPSNGVGIPMILAGEEFADQHDLPITEPARRSIQ